MNWRWFVSRTVRRTRDVVKHVRKLLNAQRDLLSPPAITALEGAVGDLRKAYATGVDDKTLKEEMTKIEAVANKWLKPYPNATIRENVEVLLVALTVAMGIRTFFVQPFKIPTGSMQPTLFGVTPGMARDPMSAFRQNNQRDLKIPGRASRFFDYWINGNSYFNEVATEDGEVRAVKPPAKFLLFNFRQEYEFNGQWHSIWFPPDDLFQRAGYMDGYGNLVPHHVKAGEPIIRMKVTAGDHLFVDRMTYNFRPPKRGEIIVFATRGTPINEQGEFYIKRLVALGGERVQIGDDYHLIIGTNRLDTNTPHFEKVYSFDPTQSPRESHYYGHFKGHDASGYDMSPLFTSRAPGDPFIVRSNYYMVMGDNTMNSSDSRVWGDFSRTNVIGKYFFVYWPFSERFGMSVK